MLVLSRPHLWIGLVALVISAGCEPQTDTAQQPAPAPAPSASPDAPATVPAPADTAPAPALPAPADNAAPEPPAPATPRTTIPGVYHGRWDRSALACAQSTSEMRLNVGATALKFYEGSSRVLAVRETRGAIEVDVEHTAEGMIDRRTYHLATTGEQLTVTIDGHAATRVRCDG
jgi:hypothetical protein